MKNIHVIPSRKPIGIHLLDYHITSDEEIKDVRPHKDKWQLEKGSILNKFPDYLTDLSECKLVIMTTDPDLIADGVQAIDDEFLQWFVKNPKCEEVEVRQIFVPSSMIYGINTNPYKIIIPTEEPKRKIDSCKYFNEEIGCNQIDCKCEKEEPKQDYSGVHLTHCYLGEYEDSCKYGENDCPAKPLEETKQETLEEAAENYVRNESDVTLKLISKYSFKDGAKWQKEKYTIEEQHIERSLGELEKAYIKGFNEGAAWKAKGIEEILRKAYFDRTDDIDVDGYWISDPEKDLEMLIEQFKKQKL